MRLHVAKDNINYFREHFLKNLAKWADYYNSKEPHNEPLPSPFDTELNDFQKMIVLRVIRPDKVCFTD